MKIIVNEKELKEYFDGLARLLMRPKAAQPPVTSEPEVEHQDASTLIEELRKAIREELASIDNAGHRDVVAPSLNKLGQVFEPYTSKPAELSTPAGTVEGIITKVGDDFLVVREHGGMSVIVPLEQLVAFQLTGKQVER
ncbi:hypothetical protein [Paenibacillus sp. OV219]|uniref:hypothetical protein n=1 Tax=Paenibacillus sp. OV219 TaxID=1884377 RepID=UPI0008CE58B3|nr:hypothetical protein [Paenibacillus sp. OV219]SEO04745.1 hypothetical protein SAMN05518847_105343 [Paenibacillus sp. OV219]